MPLQLSHCIIVIRFQRQVAVLGITLEEPSFLEESRYSMTNGMHQRFEFIHAWRIYPVKAQAPMAILHIHAVKQEHVEMDGAA